jgi:type IV secretory pathway TrbD component
MKLSLQSPLRRQGSISATELGLRRWQYRAFATLTWIPACAGMTAKPQSSLLRRDDGKYAILFYASLLRRQESIAATEFGLRRWQYRAFVTLTWIPACAGMTAKPQSSLLRRDDGKYAILFYASLLRRQESIAATELGLRRWRHKAFATLIWIPACAGMTK